MKILQIAPYMTCNDVSLLSQCKAGFGYIVYDIAKSLSRTEHVEALLNNYRYEKFECGGTKFLAAKWSLFIKNIFKCSNPFIVLKLWGKYRISLRSLVRIVYVWLISGYYYDVISKEKYDVVHIHGCGFYDEIWMDVCKRLNQKFIITLHGLNSFSESVALEPAGKRYERDFLKRVTAGEFPITVISTGIKRTIEETYNLKDCPNIFVVCNSFFFGGGTLSFDIRSKYSIPTKGKVLLYVGNISKNKNQAQLVESFSLMPKELCDSTYVLFCGRNIEPGYTLDEIIAKSPYNAHLIMCGNVDKQDIPSYYQQCDGVVLLSIAEGFGLSLIEGMHFGKPCMTFCDLDAFEDIYDPSAVVGLPDRRNETVAKGLAELLLKEWDVDAIKSYSERFGSKHMSDNYLKVYEQIIQKSI